MKRTLFIFTIAAIVAVSNSSCKKLDHQCMKAEVIGKIRTAGGGLAVSLKRNYKQTVFWKGKKHVIELLNIPVELKKPGSKFYFTSRIATANDKGPITADGDESIKLVLFGEKFDQSTCPK